MIITIDGPSASGKSSVAFLLARELKYLYLNTGLLYRACAHALVYDYGCFLEFLDNPSRKQVDSIISDNKITYLFDDENGSRILYDSVDITYLLKKSPYDKWASLLSAQQCVRDALLIIQRNIALKHNVIAEGRDCGAVVFPHADYKFFMTASLEVRAHRWHYDQCLRGVTITIEEAQSWLRERDERDSTRKAAPLVIPKDARVIDNSSMTVAEVITLLKEELSL